MRLILPLRTTWHQPSPRRHITTKPATFANIKYELLRRPPRVYWDHLTIGNSNLLSRSLNDLLPREAQIPLHPASLEVSGKYPPRLLQGHHLVYFPPWHATSSLLPDGTDADHSPGAPFTRRLWAGGSVAFEDASDQEPVLDGTRAVCYEKIEDVRVTGLPPGEEARAWNTPGAGEKIFVDVSRSYSWPRGKEGWEREDAVESVKPLAAINEQRTLCFMTPKTAEEARTDVEKPRKRVIRVPPYKPTYTVTLTPTPALLFRFSALTFNAHAIHLDRQHCREVEGYRDLLVHGPLLLTLMFSALRGALSSQPKNAAKEATSVKSLHYRNLAPVFANEEMKVCVGKGSEGKWSVWIVGPEGGLCVKGTAIVV